MSTQRCDYCDRPECPTLSVPPDAPNWQQLAADAEADCNEHSEHSDCMTGYLTSGQCDCHEFDPLQTELGRVIFREMDAKKLDLVEVQKSLAGILWGMHGGFDRDDLVSVSIRREGDSVQMVVEWDDAEEN